MNAPKNVDDAAIRAISPIAAEARAFRRMRQDPSVKAQLQGILKTHQAKREAFVSVFEEAGLQVFPVRYEGQDQQESSPMEDLSLTDDGGKPVETLLRIPVMTQSQLERVYSLAHEQGLGVMTLGARTSALGVFKAHHYAKLRGLKGVVCVDMPACWLEDQEGQQAMNKPGLENNMELPTDLLDLPQELEEGEELILSQSIPVAVIRSASGQHRVIAHATVTVSQVNRFLKEVLPSDGFHYQILPDLTSKEQATIGGVVSTGAQGGNRAAACACLMQCLLVDATGSRCLVGDDAKAIVGLNGLAGTCLQAEFEVTPFPKYPFGMIIPLRSSMEKNVWQRFMEVQQALAPYCMHPQQFNEDPVAHGNSLITSIEILGQPQMKMGVEKYGGRAQELKVLYEHPDYVDAEMYLYVTGCTPLGEDDDIDILELFQQSLFSEQLGMVSDEEDFLDDDGFLVLQDNTEVPHEGVYPLMEPELLKLVDDIRHTAPEMARSEAEKLGNITLSTDFNVQFTSDDSEDGRQARMAVSKLYHEYVEEMRNGPFRVDVYGHGYPGMVDAPLGGGLDPHIRVTLKLNDPSTRYNAPELVNRMKSRRSKLYTDLLSLHGKYGIHVAPPEKSHLTNMQYVKWLRLHFPERIEEIQRVILGDDEADFEKKMVAAFRMPIELPDEPTRGILSFFQDDLLPEDLEKASLLDFSDAVLELSQKSHRGPEVKALLREVTVSLRETLQLDPLQHAVFFFGSEAEAKECVMRSSYASDISRRPSDTHPQIITAESLGGLPGLVILVVPRSILIEAERKQMSHGNVGHRYLVDLFNRSPYETPETPNIPGIAFLGLALQQQGLDRQASPAIPPSSIPAVSLNPGPVMIDPAVRAQAREGLELLESPERKQQLIGKLNRFLGVPEGTQYTFLSSATQAMAWFGSVLQRRLSRHGGCIKALQIVNGAFSERLQSVFNTYCTIPSLRSPWTTGEASQFEQLITPLVEHIQSVGNNGFRLLIMTPHKTSTTAYLDVDVLIFELRRRGYEIGEDYELLLDVTSGLGAIPYHQKGVSFFGSVQKAMGCPPGMAIVGMSEGLRTVLEAHNPKKNDAGMDCYPRFAFPGIDDFPNTFAMACLEAKLDAELKQGRTVFDVQTDCRRKMQMVFGFLFLHQDRLSPQVPAPVDQSPHLAGFYSINRNLPLANYYLEEIFGYKMGAGYGPFSGESLRAFIANVTEDQLRDVLLAFDAVLDLPEVRHTVNPKAPLVSLREPHDPLQVMTHLVNMHERALEADDVIRYKLVLEWVLRLKYTLIKGATTPYGLEDNLKAIKDILGVSLQPGNDYHKLWDVHTLLASHLGTLEHILLEGDEIELMGVKALLSELYELIRAERDCLAKYIANAPLQPDGRPILPLTATPEQLNGNGRHS